MRTTLGKLAMAGSVAAILGAGLATSAQAMPLPATGIKDVAGAPAVDHVRWHGGRGYGYRGGYYRRGYGGFPVGAALGIAGIATAAAVASGGYPYYGGGYAYPSYAYPAYSYGYPAYGYGYSDPYYYGGGFPVVYGGGYGGGYWGGGYRRAYYGGGYRHGGFGPRGGFVRAGYGGRGFVGGRGGHLGGHRR